MSASIAARHYNPGGTLRKPQQFADLGIWAQQQIVKARDRRVVFTVDYLTEYEKGWKASRRMSENTPFHDGTSTHAYDDGYLDGVSREKWHFAYCPDPDACGEH
jgi:hypothetical protein